MKMLGWILVLVASVATLLKCHAAQTNGLYFSSSGKKTDIHVFHANVYSLDDANTFFDVRLTTSVFSDDTETNEDTNRVALRIGGHEYPCKGWGGATWNGPKAGGSSSMDFFVTNQDDAEAAARFYSTNCHLLSPPGYKLLAQFFPAKTSFKTDEPVIVMFRLKNLDERPIIFLRNAPPPPEFRDEAFVFQAQFFQGAIYGLPTPDIGGEQRPYYSELPPTPVSLAPGEVFECEVDLKKWFAFDKAGQCLIRGFHGLVFYPAPVSDKTFPPWNELWSDWVSGDFAVVVK